MGTRQGKNKRKVNPNRKTAKIFDVLPLLAGMVFGIFSSVPAVEHPDYLVKLASSGMVYNDWKQQSYYNCLTIVALNGAANISASGAYMPVAAVSFM